MDDVLLAVIIFMTVPVAMLAVEVGVRLTRLYEKWRWGE